MTRHYVCGFAFEAPRGEIGGCVLVIRKSKPEWQRGRLNGIGGSVEPGETIRQAMAREFREECGIDLPEERWEYYALLNVADPDPSRDPVTRVYFFRAFGVPVQKMRQETDEEVGLLDADDFVASISSLGVVPNLRWLIPLAQAVKNVGGPLGGRLEVWER